MTDSGALSTVRAAWEAADRQFRTEDEAHGLSTAELIEHREAAFASGHVGAEALAAARVVIEQNQRVADASFIAATEARPYIAALRDALAMTESAAATPDQGSPHA